MDDHPAIRVIDANEANMPVMGRKAIAEFDAAFARWQRRRGQEMPDSLVNRRAKKKRMNRK